MCTEKPNKPIKRKLKYQENNYLSLDSILNTQAKFVQYIEQICIKNQQNDPIMLEIL